MTDFVQNLASMAALSAAVWFAYTLAGKYEGVRALPEVSEPHPIDPSVDVGRINTNNMAEFNKIFHSRVRDQGVDAHNEGVRNGQLANGRSIERNKDDFVALVV
jgi:hypothetical protein